MLLENYHSMSRKLKCKFFIQENEVSKFLRWLSLSEEDGGSRGQINVNSHLSCKVPEKHTPPYHKLRNKTEKFFMADVFLQLLCV